MTASKRPGTEAVPAVAGLELREGGHAQGLQREGHLAIAQSMMQEPDSLRFASEATVAGIWAALCFAGAGVTIWADRRRAKRSNVDKAGWVPWPKLFFVFALVGVVLFAMAIKGWTTP